MECIAPLSFHLYILQRWIAQSNDFHLEDGSRELVLVPPCRIVQSINTDKGKDDFFSLPLKDFFYVLCHCMFDSFQMPLGLKERRHGVLRL
jgi:hypothetical protein